jgi:hypothetical protein
MTSRGQEPFPGGGLPEQGGVEALRARLAGFIQDGQAQRTADEAPDVLQPGVDTVADLDALDDAAGITGSPSSAWQEYIPAPRDRTDKHGPLDDSDVDEGQVVIRGGRVVTQSRPRPSRTLDNAGRRSSSARPNRPRQHRPVGRAIIAAGTASLIGWGISQMVGGSPDEVAINTKPPVWATADGMPDILDPLVGYVQNAANGSDASIPVTTKTRGADGKTITSVRLINPAKENPEILQGVMVVMLDGGGDPEVNSYSDGIIPMTPGTTGVFAQEVQTVKKDRAVSGESPLPSSDMLSAAEEQLGKEGIAQIRQQGGQAAVDLVAEQMTPQISADTGVLLDNIAWDTWSKGDLKAPVTDAFFTYYFTEAGKCMGLSGDKLTEYVSDNVKLRDDLDKTRSLTWENLVKKLKNGQNSPIANWLLQAYADQNTVGIAANKG